MIRELLTSSQMQAADSYTSDVIGIPSLVLMERAALKVADAADTCLQRSGRNTVSIIAGSGNNGADGIAAGRILLDRGYHVRFFLTSGHIRPGSAMETQLHILHQYGCQEHPFSESLFVQEHGFVVIDGMFGTGLSRPLEGCPESAIRILNTLRRQKDLHVISIDIPSGISSDTGEVLGCAVEADETVTFGFYKRGHFLFPGTEYCGRLQLTDIGITGRSLTFRPDMFCYEGSPSEYLPARTPEGNKGTFGKLLLLAGSVNMAGAALLAGQAAYQTGCGMVKVFTPEENRVIVQTGLPEALLSTWQSEDDIHRLVPPDLAWATSAAIGPGIGRFPAAKELVRTFLQSLAQDGKGAVIDADAIRLIADDESLLDLLKTAAMNAQIVLTPHMAECAALLHTTVVQLRKDRERMIAEFARDYHCALLCKDARSMAASWDRQQIYLNVSGSEALAKAGSGDVLCGIIAALIGQGMSAFDAACAGSYLHGRAAQHDYPETRSRMLLSMDLAASLGRDIQQL